MPTIAAMVESTEGVQTEQAQTGVAVDRYELIYEVGPTGW